MAKAADLTVDVRLTNIAEVYFDPTSFWKKIFPKTMPVGSIHTWYPFFDEGAFMLRDNRSQFRKGRDSKPKRVDFKYTQKVVNINGYEAFASKSKLDLSELSAMGIANAKETLTKAVVQTLNSFVDLDFIDLICNTSKWHTYAVTDSAGGFSGYPWTDQTNGDPEKDLKRLRLNCLKNSNGIYPPNTVVIDSEGLNYLFQHAKVKSRYDSCLASPEDKEKFFFDMIGIKPDRIFEVSKVVNTAAKGAAKDNEFYMGAYVWMGYIEPNPNQDSPTAMAPLVPQNYIGNETGVAIYQMESDKFPDGGDGIRVFGDQFTEVKQCAKDLGANLTEIYS